MSLFSDNCSINFAVPDLAIVPRLSTNSFLLIPMPLSSTVNCDFFWSTEILTLRSELSSINESLVRFAYRNLSHASEALEIISLKKICLSLYKEWVEEIQSIKAKLEHTTDEREIIKIQSEISKKNVATYNIKPYDYSPPKSELEKWKEVGLKSNYLLQELIKLGGMKYPNLEPILDMVQDIHLPPHTDNDKEIAGIPSGLTNITQTTSINE